MTVIVMAVLVLCVGLVLIRMLLGPTSYDRILAVNMLGTYVVVFIALLAMLKESSYLLDIALIYALINFITTMAFLRYFKNEN